VETTQKVIDKLAQLPKEPGVYFHKDAKGEIIYVGKAAVLNNRVKPIHQLAGRRMLSPSILTRQRGQPIADPLSRTDPSGL